MTDRETVALGTVSSRLSLAVRLVDGFTGRTPRGAQRVAVEERAAEPVVNPSGYHVFLDLDPGTVTVAVDGGREYLDERSTGVEAIDLSDPGTTVDPADPDTLPLETITLQPAPAYEFPAGTTLIRGTVLDPGDEPLPDATVTVRDRDAETRTDGNGEFVLFLDPVLESQVATVGGRRVVEVDGGPPTIAATHPDHGTAEDVLEDDGGDSTVEEGTLTAHRIAFP